MLGREAAWLLAHDDHEPTTTQAERIEAAVARRALHEPVAYITGVREFYGREFAVSSAVLIPRPETELIIEAVLEAFPDRQAPLSFADIGTGSGNIAVSLAREYPAARVTATDTSGSALVVARINAERQGVIERVTLREASLVPDGVGPFDAIVSNPPYVSLHDHDGLPPTVREFEPHAALFAGPSGLDVIEPLLAAAWRALVAGGFLAVEIGAGQAPAVVQLAEAAGFTRVTMMRDLAGIERTLTARR